MMLIARALHLPSWICVRSSFDIVKSFVCTQQSHSLHLNLSCKRFSGSSWNKFASATGNVAQPTDASVESVPQPAASLDPATTLSQKQKKISAVVERAVHAVLTRAVAPAHISRHIPYLSLNVVSISRDCYVVTIGWDCLGGDFSSADQLQMQVRAPIFFPLCLQFGIMRWSHLEFFDQNDSSIPQFHHQGWLPTLILPFLSKYLFWITFLLYSPQVAVCQHACGTCFDNQVR